MTPVSFDQVSVDAKANVYFGGKVVSHTVHFADGSKKTIGIIYPGSYHFGTAAPERMEIIAGACDVTLDESDVTTTYEAGSFFDVAGKHGFTIAVNDEICEYVCSFLDA